MSISTRRRFISLSGAAIGLGLAKISYYPRTEWHGVAFGADASITLRGDSILAKKTLKEITSDIEDLENLFSLYKPNSALSMLNRTGILYDPPSRFLDLLENCAQLHQISDGMFDPTIQGIWLAYEGRTDVSLGFQHVIWDEKQVKFNRPNMALSFNGIAQGYATDVMSDVLRSYGFQTQLVNIGEYRAGQGQWHIRLGSIKNSYDLTLSEQAVATSEPGALRFKNKQSHIINPYDMRASTKWKSITVIATNATIADGYSTAFAYFSINKIKEIRMKVDEIMRIILIDKNDEIFEI